MNLAAGVGVTAAVIMMTALGFMAKPRDDGGGSVSDLIKRGQLRADRGEYVSQFDIFGWLNLFNLYMFQYSAVLTRSKFLLQCTFASIIAI